MNRCVYIAGPMSGYPDYNFPAFDAAEARLIEVDLFDRVINPARIDREIDGFDPTKDVARDIEFYMRRDLPLVLDCSHVAVLPGWQGSRGARCEVAVGLMVNAAIIDAEHFGPLPARRILVRTRHIAADQGWPV